MNAYGVERDPTALGCAHDFGHDLAAMIGVTDARAMYQWSKRYVGARRLEPARENWIRARASAPMAAEMTKPLSPHDTPPAGWIWDAVVDGGEMGCGELLLELRLRFMPLPGGTSVLVVARDVGAPIEMPAWCRVTGHRLEQTEHPHYLIRKKPDA